MGGSVHAGREAAPPVALEIGPPPRSPPDGIDPTLGPVDPKRIGGRPRRLDPRPGLRIRALEGINDLRRRDGLPPVTGRWASRPFNGGAHALQPDLGGLPSRPDLAAPGPVRVRGAAGAEGS